MESGPKFLWPAQRVKEATGGELLGASSWEASTPSIDSRNLKKDQIFIAIEGEKLDGHAYIEAAFQKGASAALVSKLPPESQQTQSRPYIKVPDTTVALQRMGVRARQDLAHAAVLAITGSVGKTTSKDLVAFCLSSQGTCHASAKSFNTKWGVPLTLAECAPDLDYVILEIGMSQPGEILPLAKIARPSVALVTAIAPAHLQGMGTLENIAHEKSEIFRGLEPGGSVLLPVNTPQFPLLRSLAQEKGVKNIYTFSDRHSPRFDGGTPADCQLTHYEATPSGLCGTALVFGQSHTFELPLYGQHIALLGTACLGAISLMGGNVAHAAQRFRSFKASERRGTTHSLRDGVLVVDESYNANPASMAAAIRAFGERPHQGRKILILGDMLELGGAAADLHAGLEGSIRALHPQEVYLFGPYMSALGDLLRPSIPTHAFTNLEELKEQLKKNLRPRDALMVKSSNSTQLHLVVSWLLAHLNPLDGAPHAL